MWGNLYCVVCIYKLVDNSHGIRQEDPLSPYLFILCIEVLSALCEKAQLNGSLAGIRVARGCPSINHLLFANDTMFFCRSSVSSVSALLHIIRSYKALSGQCFNFLKSSVTFSAISRSVTIPVSILDWLQVSLRFFEESCLLGY